MSKFATVIIPHYRAPRWLQICISSLKKFHNERDFEVWVIDNSAGHNSIEAITKTSLGDDIQVRVIPFEDMRTPALTLDYVIDYVETHWLFSAETDVRWLRDGWLDWYASYARDDEVGIVGWYWQLEPDMDDTRHYISPAATLYNIDMLRTLKADCIANKSLIISYGKDYKERRDVRDTGDVENMILQGHWGPFAERRGFFHSYPVRPRYEQFWHDTGSWLYYRAMCQWECVKIPGLWVSQPENNCPPMKYTYYGKSNEKAFLKHYWAGAVSHGFETGMVGGWAAHCVEWWLRREYALWQEEVPEDIRKFSEESGIIPNFEEELEYAKSRICIPC